MRSDTVRVGFLVLVFFVLVYLAYIFLRVQVSRRDHYQLRVQFRDVRNLQPRAPVVMAGVPVGYVEAIRLLPAPPVAEVTLAIQREIKIPEGSKFRIPGGVLFPSEARVEIVPPAALQAGAGIQGETPADFTNLIPDFQETLVEVRKVLVATRRLLEDSELNENVKRALESVVETSDSVGRLAQSVDRLINQNREEVNHLLKEAAVASTELRHTMQQVNALLGDPQLKEDLRTALQAARQSAEHAESSLEQIQQVVADPELQRNVKETAANLRTLSEQLNTLSTETTTLIRDADTVAKRAAEVIEDSKGVVQTAKVTLERVSKALEVVPSIRSLGFGEPLYRLDILNDLDSKRYRTDATMYLPYRDERFFLLGVYDLSEANKFIFQYGSRLNPNLEIRYGLYASKPGVGVDYKVSQNTRLSLDLFNPNDFQTNLKVRFRLAENLFGWAGVESLFRDYRPTIGLQFER